MITFSNGIDHRYIPSPSSSWQKLRLWWHGAPAPAPACAWVYTDIKSRTNTNSWSHHTTSFTGFKHTWNLILDKTVDVNLQNRPKLRLFVMSPVVPFEFNVTNDGFWGDTTATLDWCEGNYEVSHGESRWWMISVVRWAGTLPSSTTLWQTWPW